jgi:hypothetical protein
MKRAKVALARKLGVVLHRMWMDATDFRRGASEDGNVIAAGRERHRCY